MTPKVTHNIFERLLDDIRKNEFSGYDPYDALMGCFNPGPLSKYWIQAGKRCPLNFRPLFAIRKTRNPKAIGIILEALSTYYSFTRQRSLLPDMHRLFRWLQQNKSGGYCGAGWGYPFHWFSANLFIRAYTPSVVATASIGRGIYQYYRVTGNPQAGKSLAAIKDFILKEIPVHRDGSGICFSYTPLRRDCVYNASLMAAEALTLAGTLAGGEEALDRAAQATRFVLNKQKPDGHWNYSMNIEDKTERQQIDFHQGFILESLFSIRNHHPHRFTGLEDALESGYRFYTQQQFHANGRSKWRLPANWPVDIHHQAQGIITHALLSRDFDAALKFARTIADWTIDHLYDQKGCFYYQKWPFLTNKITYLRWAQAWMLKALSLLQHA
ncbi:hypothetical protein GF407_05850 [candidate division KSB1 bacterium]|nr:hypothetical protein [candidate division KSB1 bacterium]